jgi:hypothetical protein
MEAKSRPGLEAHLYGCKRAGFKWAACVSKVRLTASHSAISFDDLVTLPPGALYLDETSGRSRLRSYSRR